MKIKAYKAFKYDMTCINGFKYEEGKYYETDEQILLCTWGFHACILPLDCLLYYPIPDPIFHEVYLDSDIDHRSDMFLLSDSIVCASKITIGREITLDEMHDIEKELWLDSGDNHAMNEFLESYFKVYEENREFLANVIRKYIGLRGDTETEIRYTSLPLCHYFLYKRDGSIIERSSITPNYYYNSNYIGPNSLPLKF